MVKSAARAAALIGGIAIILSIIISAICVFGFNRQFYADEYKKLNTAEEIGITEAELTDATEVLLDYMQGKREDMVVYAEFDGVTEEVYGEREKAHMVDVRALYDGAVTVAWAGGIFGIVFIAAAFVLDKREAIKGYITGNVVFFAVFAGLAIWAATDFYTFWIKFHHIFFTNDLWLLDPATDVLIQMVPEQFFFDLVMRIAITSLAVIIVLLVAAIIANVRLKKKEAAA